LAKINASGLTTQLRKASVSIDGNSAEGCATSTAAHFKKLLENAVGSAFAIETQLLIAAGGYVDLKENIEKILTCDKRSTKNAKFINRKTETRFA